MKTFLFVVLVMVVMAWVGGEKISKLQAEMATCSDQKAELGLCEKQ